MPQIVYFHATWKSPDMFYNLMLRGLEEYVDN